MSSNNLSVSVTADVQDLQVKFAIAKAEVNGLTSEMNKLAKASATGTIDAAGSARLKQFAGDLLAARQASQGYAAELEKAGFSVSTFGQKMGEGHGSISTATREFRALFDELSSGRTRQTPGTLAIIAQRVIGLGPAALGATAGVLGLVGGLAYLTVKSIETSRALDQALLGAQFAGNLSISRDAIKQFADDLSQAKNISSSDAREIAATLASIPGIATPVFEALKTQVSDFAAISHTEGPKAAEELAKIFNSKTTAADFARSIGGITQAQINMAEAADRSGDALKEQEAKLSLLIITTGRSATTIDQQNNQLSAGAKNWLGYFGALSQGISAEEFSNQLIEDSNRARQRNLDIIRQTDAELNKTKNSPEETLKTGVATADKENPVAKQIDEAKSKIGEMNAALAIAKQRSDQVSVDKLTAGLAKANENLSNLQFGPVLERMREQMAQVAATWDGTQSGMLAKQIQVAQGTLASVQQNAKERVQVETEIAHLEVQQRQAAGAQIIAEARSQVAAINGETALGGVQRLEKERDVWVQTLAGDRLTAAQRLEVARSINQDIASIAKEQQSQAQAIARSNADTDIAIARLSLQAKKTALDEEVQAGQIASSQKLGLLREFAAQEFATNLKALEDELRSRQEGTLAYAESFNQIRELKAKLVQDLAKLDKQNAADVARAAREEVSARKMATNEILSAEGALVSDLLGRRKTLSQSLLQIGNQLITQEITNDLKAMTMRMMIQDKGDAETKALAQGGFAYHQIVEMMKTHSTIAGEQARTSAQAAGDAARLTSQASAAAAGKVAQMAIDRPQIQTDAAKAAAGAYSALAGIPIVGPILAPIAAGVAYTAVSAYESFDVGTNYVPRNMTANIHEGEAIVPKRYNPAAGGDAAGAGGAGDTTHNNYGGNNIHVSGSDLKRMLASKANQRALMDTIAGAYRRGAR